MPPMAPRLATPENGRVEGGRMDYDVVVIGAGAGGEAAGSLSGQLGGRVAVVERDLIGGLAEAGYWTSNDGTSVRDLPSSILVMGGGAVGTELAQVYGRFGVRTTLVQGTDRILPRDHPKSGQILADQLRGEGVEIRTGVTATKVESGGAGRVVTLSDGSTVEAAQVMVA